MRRGWQWRERIYSSAEELRSALRTAAKGMRQHVGHWISGVVQASEPKGLRAGGCRIPGPGVMEKESREGHSKEPSCASPAHGVQLPS